MKRLVRSLGRRLGVELGRYDASTSADARRLRIVELSGADVVLDVGANVGQYASALRASGYRGRIVSFEPQVDAFARLERAARSDPGWTCVNVALGSADMTTSITVAGSTQTSSILPVEQELAALPEWRPVGSEQIEVRRLDAIAHDVLPPEARAFLKIDTQGYELEVLRGAEETLGSVHALELELLLVPLYEGQPDYRAVLDHLDMRGFRLAAVDPGYVHAPSGHMVFFDGLFVRKA